MSYVEIGNRIKEARIKKGMSLSDIAENIGLAKSTIQRYESGTIKRIKLPVIEALAKELQVNPSWLALKSDDMYGSSSSNDIFDYIELLDRREDIRLLVNMVADYSPDKLNRIMDIIAAIDDITANE